MHERATAAGRSFLAQQAGLPETEAGAALGQAGLGFGQPSLLRQE